MALITCPRCGRKISDKAQVCVHCGHPMQEKQTPPLKFFTEDMTKAIAMEFQKVDEALAEERRNERKRRRGRF
ncbi:zinc ribbon domain-containing protein [uncultured Dysosmobacter sp.]|uniref:zinc ribbon domain-containing protein n=1 Tax=uncultured Dysosmobacter sp. TaxID=2591384 RepID=UPI0026151643|nr:zinc ribbon domain-containing protein [uncultured Dysosmobacter sp.]